MTKYHLNYILALKMLNPEIRIYLELAIRSLSISTLYLIVNLVFPHPDFSSGNFFLTAPFPDHCLLTCIPYSP